MHNLLLIWKKKTEYYFKINKITFSSNIYEKFKLFLAISPLAMMNGIPNFEGAINLNIFLEAAIPLKRTRISWKNITLCYFQNIENNVRMKENKNTKYIISQIEFDVKMLKCKKGTYDVASVNMTFLILNGKDGMSSKIWDSNFMKTQNKVQMAWFKEYKPNLKFH